jgi:leucyl aminopeptidase
MKSIATAILAAIALALAACSSTPSTSTSSSAAILSTTVDMTTASKAAYAARASYFVYLTVADKVKKNVPICSAATQATICITTDQMAVLKTTELSTDQATLAGVTAVRALGNNPSAIASAITLANAAVESFKAQTDIWRDKVKS